MDDLDKLAKGLTEVDDEGPCTDCWDTGITTQTERLCSCNTGLALKAHIERSTHD